MLSLDGASVGFHNHIRMARPLGAAAAVVTWVGWLTICPALGFPVVGTAAMVNRAFFPKIPEAGHDPNFWLGWLILIGALGGAIAVFFILERLRLIRANVLTGVIYSAALWLFSGVVVMPILGIADPSPQFPANLDPMQPSVMMYALGPLASVAALIGWALFGATLGATWSAGPVRDTAPAGVSVR